MKPTNTKPALGIKSLFKKFLCMSMIFLFCLNLLIAYLIFAYFPLFNNPKRSFIVISFFLSSILSFSFSILFTYIHLFKASLRPKLIFKKILFIASVFIWLDFWSSKKLFVTDLIQRFKLSKTLFTSLH